MCTDAMKTSEVVKTKEAKINWHPPEARAGMTGRARCVILALTLLSAGVSAVDAAEQATLRFERLDGVFVVFSLEIARSDAERRQGLMHRRSLSPTGGMLFDFGADQDIAMWMRNTYVALDMVFVSADGVIVDILTNTVPLSETLLAPRAPARYVVELLGGQAAARGLAAGDRLRLPAALRSSP